MKEETWNWEKFDFAARTLAKQLKPKKYGSILAVSRGGLTLGQFLSEQLGLPLGLIAAIKTKDGGCKVFSNRVLQIFPEVEKESNQKNVLIVDDLIDNGRTIRYVVSWLRKYTDLIVNDGKVGVCVLVRKKCRENETITQEVFAFEQNKKNWVNFPWDKKKRRRKK